MNPTIAEIMEQLPAALDADAASGVSAVVHFKFTGTEAGEWNAVIREGRCSVSRGIPRERPSISLAADSTSFIEVISGKMDVAQAVMQGKLKLGGDGVLAERILRLFKSS